MVKVVVHSDIGAYEYQGAGGFARSEQYRVLGAPDSASALLPPAAQAARPAATVVLTGTAISYTYDALYRLTRADYTGGGYFAYAYDAVGNRTLEVACTGSPPCAPITTTYSYDDANRLASVNGQAYTWDANGNLLADGVLTYTYDAANRLIGTTDGLTTTTSFAYNGLGNRVNQVVNGVVTTYTLDLAAGLTQVLADGTFTYLVGNGRIAQATLTQTAYFLGDALGSVRHLVDSAGQVTLARSYEPYGDVLTSAGSGVTSYSFTGEWRDGSGLVYLRARYYASGVGRFVTRDMWPGEYRRPLTRNGWLYVQGNPLNLVDPSGMIASSDGPEADRIWADLWVNHGIQIEKDWGPINYTRQIGRQGRNAVFETVCAWAQGRWRNLDELKWIQAAVQDAEKVFVTTQRFRTAMQGPVSVTRLGITTYEYPFVGTIRGMAPPSILGLGDVILPDSFFPSEAQTKYFFVHELGHVWDRRTGLAISDGMSDVLGTTVCFSTGRSQACKFDTAYNSEAPPGKIVDPYAGGNAMEDWAEAFASFVYRNHYSGAQEELLGAIREQYVQDQLSAIP